MTKVFSPTSLEPLKANEIEGVINVLELFIEEVMNFTTRKLSVIGGYFWQVITTNCLMKFLTACLSLKIINGLAANFL